MKNILNLFKNILKGFLAMITLFIGTISGFTFILFFFCLPFTFADMVTGGEYTTDTYNGKDLVYNATNEFIKCLAIVIISGFIAWIIMKWGNSKPKVLTS